MGKLTEDVLGKLKSNEKAPSLATEIVAGMFGMDAGKVAAARESQPSLVAELGGLWRQGREDVINNLLTAFPANLTREPGAPGNPTQQMTTEQLTGQEVNQNDRVQGRGR